MAPCFQRIQLPSPGLRSSLPGFVLLDLLFPVFLASSHVFDSVKLFVYFQSHRVCCQIQSIS
jgi:hypothetical protein